jgi:hypothetical protein
MVEALHYTINDDFVAKEYVPHFSVVLFWVLTSQFSVSIAPVKKNSVLLSTNAIF